jgi:PAS domain S-box-containing protein
VDFEMGDSSRSIRVLHVEDDPDFAEITELKLDEHGDFDLAVETDPTDALERFETGEFDCLLSDYDMPRLDGLELLDAVRDQYPAVPFVLFTGKGSERIASEAISAGVTDYLQKGGGSDTFALLANRVQNAVASYYTERELRAERRLSKRIVSASPVAIVVHDYDGDVILANDRAQEILGVGTEELDARAYADSSWRLLDADGEYVPFEELPHSRVVAGEEVRNDRYTVHTGDGRARDIVVHGAPLHDEDGDIEGAVIPFDTVADE